MSIVREIFPFLTAEQITLELRRVNGNIDNAILSITENVQRGVYQGID